MTETTPPLPAPLRVLTIGGGALGILYSFLLARAGCHISIVARSNAQLLRERGVDLISKKYGDALGWKPDAVLSEDEAKEHDFDYILCTFKIVPELQPTSALLKKVIKPPTPGQKRQDRPTIVFVENGMGIEREPYETLCLTSSPNETPLASTIISSCAWLGANLVDGGKRVEHGGLERLEMGLFPTPGLEERDGAQPAEKEHAEWKREKLARFVEGFKAGGGGGELLDDIQPARWKKLLWNATWGALCTVARQPVIAMLDEDCLAQTRPVIYRMMLEILYVARWAGITEEMMPSAAVEQTLLITLDEAPSRKKPGEAPRLAVGFKPSLLLDLESPRPMELVAIIENVIAMARKANLPTPRLDVVLAALRPAQVIAVREARKRAAEQGAEVPGHVVATGFPEGDPVGI